MLSGRRHVYALLYVPDACSTRVMPYGGRAYRNISISTIRLDLRQGDPHSVTGALARVLELVLDKVRACFPPRPRVLHSRLLFLLAALESYLPSSFAFE